LKKDGSEFYHYKEGRDALNALTKQLDIKSKNSIHSRLAELYKAGHHDTLEIRLLREKLSDISKLKDKYMDLTKEAACQIKGAKLTK
jgi:hypothetical protein